VSATWSSDHEPRPDGTPRGSARGRGPTKISAANQTVRITWSGPEGRLIAPADGTSGPVRQGPTQAADRQRGGSLCRERGRSAPGRKSTGTAPWRHRPRGVRGGPGNLFPVAIYSLYQA